MTTPVLWVVALGGLVLLAGSYVFVFRCLGRFTRALSRRYEARLAEQDRVARELHDWLLQGTQGLMLHVQAISTSHALEGRTRLMLEKTLDHADRFIDRERFCLARNPVRLDTSLGLFDALSRLGRELAAAGPAGFEATPEGQPRGLRPDVLEGAALLGGELLRGAFARPEAGTIRLKLRFAREGLVLKLGVQRMEFDSALAAARLRACRFGGRIEVWRRLGAGTEIELRIPADVAYLRRQAGLNGLRLRLQDLAPASDP